MTIDIIFFLLIATLDIAVSWHFHGMNVDLSFAQLFLIWMIFRKNFLQIVLLSVVLALMLLPFTNMPFMRIIAAHVLVLGLFSLVRVQIYTESYLTLALWASCITFVLILTTHLFHYGVTHVLQGGIDFFELASQSIFSAMAAVPCFVLFDRFNDFARNKLLREKSW